MLYRQLIFQMRNYGKKKSLLNKK